MPPMRHRISFHKDLSAILQRQQGKDCKLERWVGCWLALLYSLWDYHIKSGYRLEDKMYFQMHMSIKAAVLVEACGTSGWGVGWGLCGVLSAHV